MSMSHDCAAVPLLDSLTKAGKPQRNMYSFFCATLASMTAVPMGYDLAVISGAQLFIREDLGLSDSQTEVLAGSINAEEKNDRQCQLADYQVMIKETLVLIES
ncbi:hypothetical protein EJB05_19959, partial [Eragrostis curvula]